MSLQLQVLAITDIETCSSLTIGWSGISAPRDSRFNLQILQASDTAGTCSLSFTMFWAFCVTSAVLTIPCLLPGSDPISIGQAIFDDAQFRWLRVAVGPGSYIINATRASNTSTLVFQPTFPFTVVAGTDISCVQFFREGLSTSTTATTTTDIAPTNSTPAGDGGSPKSNIAVIAGGAAAGVVVLLLLAGMVWLWLRRRKHAPVAVRKRRTTLNSSIRSLGQDKAGSLGHGSDSIPLTVVMPVPPLSPRQQTQQAPQTGSVYTAYPRSLPPPPPEHSLEPQHRAAPYAESTAMSDDSFAEERDALRAEFQSSDGTTSAGGRGRNGRPFSAIESSVGTDAGLGLERDRVGGTGAPPVPYNDRRPKQMTFAVSNPDHTVWEDEVYGGRTHASRR